MAGAYKVHLPMIIIHFVAFILCLACGIFLIVYSHFLSASLVLLDHIRDDDQIFVIDPILRSDSDQKASTEVLRDCMLAVGIIAVLLALVIFVNILLFLSLMGGEGSCCTQIPPFGKIREHMVEEVEYIEYYAY